MCSTTGRQSTSRRGGILARRPFAVADGERVSFARCGHSIHANNKHVDWWPVEAFERTFLALEHGVMKGAAAQKVKVCPGGAEEVDEANRSI